MKLSKQSVQFFLLALFSATTLFENDTNLANATNWQRFIRIGSILGGWGSFLNKNSFD